MMTGLTIVLAVNLLLFLGALLFAVAKDWVDGHTGLYRKVSEQVVQPGGLPVQFKFHRAARRPMRVLGSYIF